MLGNRNNLSAHGKFDDLSLDARVNDQKVLIVPHSDPQGGAGLYTQRMIDVINEFAWVDIEGRFAELYRDPPSSSFEQSYPNTAIIPLYSGVRLTSLLYHIALLPARLFKLIKWLRLNGSNFKAYDIVIFTSSIDILQIIALKMFGITSRMVCIIQENIQFRGIKRFIMKLLFQSSDVLVVISRDSARSLASVGLSVAIAPNPFKIHSADQGLTSERSIDLLYVGGDQKIKGFDFFIKLIERLVRQRVVNIQILGKISTKSQKRLEEVQSIFALNGSKIEAIGFVENTQIYYQSSKLLILPITHPHFCRPAIEAGLNYCPFIVTDLDGLDDFADFGYNCISARKGDLDEWLKSINFLLDSTRKRSELSRNNSHFAKTNFSNDLFENVYKDILLSCFQSKIER